MAMLETIATKSLVALATKITTKFADLGWNKVSEEFQATLSEKNVIDYCRACDEYVNIRTLYSSQYDVFIDDVYVPLFMSPTNDRDIKIEITNLSYYNSGITNIIGKAGQGKSTFLRKMLINEIKSGVHLPVFFELKYFNPDLDLLSQIVDWFNRHKIKLNEKGVSRLLKNGFVKLFLDGFDEMPPSLHDNALSKIKDLSREFPKTTIIVTTRPDTLITTEPYISNYHVLDLEVENIRKLFLNISKNNIEITNDAMEQIEKNQCIKNITKTPILAILLFITYRAWSKIPDNLSDFYKKIFITLLTHHDSLKAGKKINRGINIPLNDYQIEDIFSVFCFKTFSDGLGTFSRRQANDIMGQSLQSEFIENVCPINLVEVIKQCTGIICSNGYDDLVFSHKSLQEYYTALYIKNQCEDDKDIFYNAVRNHEEESKYREVLKFLCGIDTYNYTKNYYVPCFKETFNVINVEPEITDDQLRTALNSIFKTISIPFNFNDNPEGNYKIGLFVNLDEDKSSYFLIKAVQLVVFALFESKIYKSYRDDNTDLIKKEIEEEGDYVLPLNQLIENAKQEQRVIFDAFMVASYGESLKDEHKYLIDKLNHKRKPSLLNRVFNDKSTSVIYTGS